MALHIQTGKVPNPITKPKTPSRIALANHFTANLPKVETFVFN